MRLYKAGSSAVVALAYSEDFTLGLELFDETKPLVQVVNSVHEPLEAANEGVKNLLKPRRKAKRLRELAEWRAEQLVDEVAGQCEAADGHRPRGATSRSVFPDGVGPVKAPKGSKQVTELTKLVNALANSADPKVKALSESHGARLSAAATTLDEADKAYLAARKQWRDAEDLEDLRLTEHRRTMDSILGEIRKLFPGDRAIQNLIVPDVDSDDRSKKASEEPRPGGDAPTA